VKPGDLVTTYLHSIEASLADGDPVVGIIIKEIPNWDRRCFKVLWSNGELLSEDSVDLKMLYETR
jgi:hypothetical protein